MKEVQTSTNIYSHSLLRIMRSPVLVALPSVSEFEERDVGRCGKPCPFVLQVMVAAVVGGRLVQTALTWDYTGMSC